MNLADYLRASTKLLLFTGAGISTASGIPDFRGPQGVWTRRQPVYFDEFMSSEAARMEHWDYKLEGWEAFRGARPNVVHHAIVRLERAGKLLCVVTQNIDGLHSRRAPARSVWWNYTARMAWWNARAAIGVATPSLTSNISLAHTSRRAVNAADT